MQKIVLFGVNTQLKNLNKGHSKNHICANCQKLQKQLDYLHEHISHKSQRSIEERAAQSQESQTMKLLQIQLQDIKEKYLTFRKKIQSIEKENQTLFQENSNLEKQLSICRQKIRQFYTPKSPNVKSNESEGKEKSSQHVYSFSECKRLQIQMFVERQKTIKLQNILKQQTDELNRLKQLLKKRKRLQQQRHKLLEVFV